MTNFVWNKIERTRCGLKGELQDVIRNEMSIKFREEGAEIYKEV